MKRLNPQTGKPFKLGDDRGDGYVFYAYKNVIKKDGFFGEKWRTKESVEKELKYKASLRAENPEKYRAANAKYRANNLEKIRASNVKYASENADKIKENARKRYAKNPEKYRERFRKYYAANREKFSEFHKKYKEKNLEKERLRWRKNNAKYWLENRESVNAYSAKRHAAKLKRTPNWLTKQQLQDIQDFYTIAQMFRMYTGEMYHVDHIVPLRGKNVSGLHVPWNLQVLPALENLSKNNSHDA